MVKAGILEGDPECPDLLPSSIYDVKPMHYLSMVSNELKWKKVSKSVFNVDTGEMEI